MTAMSPRARGPPRTGRARAKRAARPGPCVNQSFMVHLVVPCLGRGGDIAHGVGNMAMSPCAPRGRRYQSRAADAAGMTVVALGGDGTRPSWFDEVHQDQRIQARCPGNSNRGNFESLAWPSSHITGRDGSTPSSWVLVERNATCLLSFSGSSSSRPPRTTCDVLRSERPTGRRSVPIEAERFGPEGSGWNTCGTARAYSRMIAGVASTTRHRRR